MMVNPRRFRRVLTMLLLVVGRGLTGCVQKPENVEPVQSFDVERYLGQWYEIARLDHSFERGLSHVTATYSWRDDGGVKVINRGYGYRGRCLASRYHR